MEVVTCPTSNNSLEIPCKYTKHVQSRLGHTVERLIDVHYELLEQFSTANAEIYFEIGISGQSSFSEDGSKTRRGSDVFVTSLVPVQVIVGL
jgi:hypothetical protein